MLNFHQLSIMVPKIIIKPYILILLFSIIIVGVVALDEINSRETFLAYLRSELTVSQQNLNELSIANANIDKNNKEYLQNTDKLAAGQKMLQTLKHLEVLTISLALQGTWDKESTLPYLLSKAAGAPPPRDDANTTVGFLRNTSGFELIRHGSSGILIGILMIAAAALGSGIYSIRDEQSDRFFENFVSGLGAGIVCYLAIQGNSIQYLASVPSTSLSASTKVLLGFISGFYSSHVYQLMTHVVVEFVKKFINNDSATKATPTTDATPPADDATPANGDPAGNDQPTEPAHGDPKQPGAQSPAAA